MTNLSIAALLGAVAALATYCGVARFQVWAESRLILDLPNERSSHTHPTPRGGGLVVVAVILACGSALIAVSPAATSWLPFLSYAAGAILVAAISWIDDLRTLPTSVRLAVHLAAALLAVAGLGFWTVIDLPLFGRVSVGWWGLALVVFWIVGLTNAYNFMDGIDGIAGLQAVIAGLGWAIMGWSSGDALVGGLGCILACSSLGFLLHNWPPARIFMGDVGSAFLGYTLATLPIMMGTRGSENEAALVVGVSMVWPFVFDATFTLLRRLSRGENILAAHRSHLYQRLVAAGSSHRRVALIYGSLALIGCLVAQRGTWWTGHHVGYILMVLLSFGLWLFVVVVERSARRG